ncbi:hypothetical protein D4L85_25710 [Chryseolinea soli]|uniref:Amidohydrolase-related domain-containing protein n=2 Tax=Chryseolinea soli TaxID=2321403 RepID=A0A385SUG0_9BACT|nr:hypothetical protein D4L85_25710 [Chryseolinea soli]
MAIVLLFVVFFKSGRNILWFILKKIWSFLGVLPGPESRALAKRYLNIGRFAFYESQTRIFARLKSQYPAGTGFIVLPMDMEFMGAGKLKKGAGYHEQMKVLSVIKQNHENKDLIYPFVFADPRRLAREGEKHLNYTVDNGSVTLKDCFIREYIEGHRFSGFKIYPALGYYPFDEALLPIWKYAADHSIPILTHCIKGTIYYRGLKQKEWDYHPVFEQACGHELYEPMVLTERKNSEFINNFTHPLNYLCLLEEKLLRKCVAMAKDKRIKELFGFTHESNPLKYDLRHLKLCLGHFGGDDEWDRFMELDRDNFSSQLVKHPDLGISFLTDENGHDKRGKLEQVWKYADWYSIICSMILQYPNVYADLSYILYNASIQPLLKQTLANPKLMKRTLFGTDFYVVRNHNSEKSLLAGMLDNLTQNEFDQIAKSNPREFLWNKLHGAVAI